MKYWAIYAPYNVRQRTATVVRAHGGGGGEGAAGDGAWYGRNNVGLILNKWLQKHQKHNNNSIIKQDILHNIYHLMFSRSTNRSAVANFHQNDYSS